MTVEEASAVYTMPVIHLVAPRHIRDAITAEDKMFKIAVLGGLKGKDLDKRIKFMNAMMVISAGRCYCIPYITTDAHQDTRHAGPRKLNSQIGLEAVDKGFVRAQFATHMNTERHKEALTILKQRRATALEHSFHDKPPAY